MFFSQDILQKRGGKFGIVWIAATKPIQLTRREYSSVNVCKTCDDIIQYITVNGSPVKAGGGRPRFSLYLSSQLMYGVIRIYNRQQQYLMGDITALCTRFQNAQTMQDIDLRLPVRPETQVNVTPLIPDLRVPGAIYSDPFFGAFGHDGAEAEELLYPTEILDIEIWKTSLLPVAGHQRSRESTLESSDISLSPSPRQLSVPFSPELGSPLQADRHRITLQEVSLSPIVPPEELTIPGEQDIPALPDDFMAGDMARQERETSLDGERRETMHERRQLLAEEDSGLAHSPHMPVASSGLELDLFGTVVNMDREVLPPLEETPAVMAEMEVPPTLHHLAAPAPTSPDVTAFGPTAEGDRPVPERCRLSKRERLDLELSLPGPPDPSPAKRRKRQLHFADAEIQIPKVQLQQHMRNHIETCLSKSPRQERMEEKARPVPHTVLLGRPTGKTMLHRKWSIFTENCKTKPAGETDSEKATPVWCVPELCLETSNESVRSPPLSALGDIQLSPVPGEHHLAEDIIAGGPEVSLDCAAAEAHTARHPNVSEIEREREISTSLQKAMELSRERVSCSELPSLSRSREELLSLLSKSSESVRERSRLGKSYFEVPEEVPEVAEEQEAVTDAQPRIWEPAAVHTTRHEQQLLRSPTHQHFIRLVSSQTAKRQATAFSKICPPGKMPRPQAVRLFSCLLDLAKLRAVVVKQDVPYGEICIDRPRGE